MSPRQRSAFTLIELLVVVAIIALLIAILLPSLGKAKATAMRSKCAASLKGWGVAVYTYTQEYNGYFGPKIGNGGQSQWDQDPGLYGAQSANTLQTKLKYCPADSSAMPNPSYQADPVLRPNGRPLPSYKFIIFQPRISNVSYWQLVKFKDVSNKLLMCDSNSQANFGDLVGTISKNDSAVKSLQDELINTAATTPSPRNTGWDTQKELQERHRGTGSVLFLDGHVGIHPWKDFVANIPSGSGTDPLDKNRTWTTGPG